MNNLFGKDEDILYEDFQGWPVYRMTFRDILNYMQFNKTEINGKECWYIEDENPMLDIYPRVLRDDGMGYGVDERWISSFSPVEENNKVTYINVFAEKKEYKNE